MIFNKEQIRKDFISACKLLESSYRIESAVKLMHNLSELINRANSVAIYHAYGFELDLLYVIKHCLELGRKVYQPIAYRETRMMRFAEVNQYTQGDENYKVFYAIDDAVLNEIEWYNIDLILLPIVAVSKDGYRLGKGGGYYDATFSKINELTKKPILCGVGFDIQIIDTLPVEAWDIKLDYFISEKRFLKF